MKQLMRFHSNAVWPPPLSVGLFVVLYGIVAACLWLIELAAPDAGQIISDTPEILNIRRGIILGAAGLYAAYRIWRFHPACNQAYSAWLKLSPWGADKPLPLGPIHPVWQDTIVIGALTMLAVWHAHLHPASPVTVFGFAYLCGMSLLLAFTRRWGTCLVLGFLWPALMLPGVEGALTVLLIITMVVVVWLGHRSNMQAFPWVFLARSNQSSSSVLQMEIRINGSSGSPATGTPSTVGWPFTVLSPKIHYYSIATMTSLGLSALFGWWSFCLIERAKIEPMPELILIFALIASVFRLAIYCAGVRSSFNLWGRIASGRIIVPGFDRVLLTPLAAVLVAIVGGMVIRLAGTSYPLAECVVITLVWIVLLSGGPTLKNWVLTGQHRFRPPARRTANKQQLRSV